MDIQEVEQILDNLRWLQGKMPTALANWQSTSPNCNYNTGILKEICTLPGKLNSVIFDPLIKWLADYILNREGRIAFSGSIGLNNFLKQGLRIISNYIAIADFFSKNPDFFITANQSFFEANQTQKQYRDFLNLLSSKLIGCNEKLQFVFLSLSKTIPSLPNDLRDMQNYLERQCLSLRVRKLN